MSISPNAHFIAASRMHRAATLRRLIQTAALLMSTLWLATPSLALESDRKQPIEITADQAELDETKGEAHYIGNVLLTQGSLTIRADNLTIKADDKNQIQRVTAKGKPAEFNQTPEEGKPPVVAKAKLIDYYVAEEKLILQLDAIVIQNDSTFQGNQIQYDIRNHRMQANSNGTKTSSSERVKMILPPNNGSEANGDTPPNTTPNKTGTTNAAPESKAPQVKPGASKP